MKEWRIDNEIKDHSALRNAVNGTWNNIWGVGSGVWGETWRAMLQNPRREVIGVARLIVQEVKERGRK